MSDPSEIPFNRLIEALLDAETPLHPRYLYRLSDLTTTELNLLKESWQNVPLWRRQALMEDLEELSAADMLLSFEAICRYATDDEDPKVRKLAFRILSEFELEDLVPEYLRLLEADPDAETRAEIATALGRFVYLGEIEEIDREDASEIEDHLLEAFQRDPETLVRRRALEALSFSSRPEVEPLIEQAYETGEKDWVVTALFAMGRSMDERWEPIVLKMLESKVPDIRGEAARAAGELEISEANPYLLEMLEDPDEFVRSAAIWSLSQIGGEGVHDALASMLVETEDEEEADLLEAALDNLAFMEGMPSFSLFDFPENDLESELDELFEDEEDFYISLDDDDGFEGDEFEEDGVDEDDTGDDA
jgi:HEAT repeat protein